LGKGAAKSKKKSKQNGGGANRGIKVRREKIRGPEKKSYTENWGRIIRRKIDSYNVRGWLFQGRGTKKVFLAGIGLNLRGEIVTWEGSFIGQDRGTKTMGTFN